MERFSLSRIRRSLILSSITIMTLTFDANAFQGIAGWAHIRPPIGLTYSSSSPTYTKWSAITNNTPSSTGGPIASYSVSPALPAGLTLNTSTGVISGTPEASDPTGTNYTITATNGTGSAQVVINIKVTISNFTWIGGGGNSNWTTGANWKGGVAPTGLNTAIFDDECGANCNATIDADITLGGIQLRSSYTGVLTQSGTNKINLGSNSITNTNGFTQYGGTFAGGSGNIRADFVRLYGGTFTSTSGELRVGYAASHTTGTDTFLLDTGATFNHHNGRFYVDASGGSSALRLPFMFTLNQDLVLYDFDFDVESTSIEDGYYNHHFAKMSGSVANIKVYHELHFYDGGIYSGTLQFYGTDARFHCADPVTLHPCATGQAGPGGAGYAGLFKINFMGPGAQTYTFDSGASAATFVINNISGVSTSSTGDFGINGIDIQTGTFTAPAGILHLFWYFNSRYEAIYGGFNIAAAGTFNHNNGTVEFNGSTGYADNRRAFELSSALGSITFYNLTVNAVGDTNNGAAGRDDYYISFADSLNVIVQNDLHHKDGRLTASSGGPGANLYVRGNSYRECSDVVNDRCAGVDVRVNRWFDTAGTTINVAAGAEDACSLCSYIFTAPGTVTINSSLNGITASSPYKFDVASGTTVNLTSGAAIGWSGRLTNNGVITCSGGAHLTYGSFSGTPESGNDPTCYGP